MNRPKKGARIQRGWRLHLLVWLLGLGALAPAGAQEFKPERRVTSANLADWQQKAQAGDAEAQFQVGAYFDGGAASDPQQSAHWYLAAAQQGHAWGQYMTGLILRRGWGGAMHPDPVQGLKWLRSAADQGLPMAQDVLGRLYFSGDCLETAQGQALAPEVLQRFYQSGVCIAPDVDQATMWLQKAAIQYQDGFAQGDLEAQYRLGLLYYEGLGVPEDRPRAKILISQAAHKGNVSAQVRWARWLEETDHDATQALIWWRRAAAQGSAPALMRLQQETAGR